MVIGWFAFWASWASPCSLFVACYIIGLIVLAKYRNLLGTAIAATMAPQP